MSRFTRIERTVTMATGLAVLGGYIVFRIFNMDYVQWATLQHPQDHDMAALQALMFGVPVAGVCGFLIFCAVLFWRK